MANLLYYNTVNDAKHAEIEQLFLDQPGVLQRLSYSVTEIMSTDLRELVRAKAAAAYQRYRVPLFVEHGGLYIEHLRGLPGPLVKPVWQALGGRICSLIPPEVPRQAYFIDMICYCDGKSRQVFEGRVEGEIALSAVGTGGFHWHPVFVPTGASRTLADMTAMERASFGGAAEAVMQLRKHLGV